MNLFLYKPFQKQLAKLERGGGAAGLACREVNAAINNWRHKLPVTIPRTKRGESRIPYAVKYDLYGYHRLVTIEHDNARVLVWLGSHDDVEHWIETHRGAQFVVNKRGMIEFTRIESDAIDVQVLQETPPDAPLLSGPVLRLLPERVLAMLRLPAVVQTFFKLITFEQLIENDDLWQVIHDQNFDSDVQRSATLDAIDHLRHGRLAHAITRIEVYAGEATAAPATVAAALEGGTASDTLANLSALTDEDFNHRFQNSNYADWLLFLHPEQKKHVGASHAGPSRLIGVSGSGKTCVLVHRASELATRYPGERILILVLNESLRQLLDRLVEHLCPESQRKQIEVMRVYDYCRGVVKAVNPQALINLYDPFSGEDLAQCWRDFTNRPHAKSQSKTLRSNIKAMNVDPWGYLHDELIWVRTGTGARKSERKKYLTADRVGRSLLFPVVESLRAAGDLGNTTTGFRPDTRLRVLDLLKDYEEYMAAGGLLDEDGVALLAYEHRHHISRHPSLRARCVLVDEAQDCSTTQLGVVSLIPTAAADGLMLVGDPVQKVFPRQQHLKSADIDIRGRASRLSINYRNTRQILDAAYPIINAFRAFSPVPAEDVLEPELACRTGPRPQLIVCSSNNEQWECVEALVKILRETGTPSVCVGSPRPAIEMPPRRRRDAQPAPLTKPLVDKTLLAICERRGWPVMAIEGRARLDALAESVIGAKFEDMKGFEFKHVILVDLQDRPLLPDSIPFKEHWRVAFQLYVAMTRAQEGLWMFAVNTPSKLLAWVRDFVDIVTPDQLLGRATKSRSLDDGVDGDLATGTGARPILPPIPTRAQLPPARPQTVESFPSDGGSEADEDEDDANLPQLPFNPNETPVERMIKYAIEYADNLDVYDRIMVCLNDQDTSDFAVEMASLRRHWRELIRGRNGTDDEESEEVEWPSHASMSQSKALSGKVFPLEQGMLSFMGYHVGVTSELTESERRAILRYVFHGILPIVGSVAYTAEWGAPSSAARLSKLRMAISTFIENARRREADMSVAIVEWRKDLDYIRQFRISV